MGCKQTFAENKEKSETRKSKSLEIIIFDLKIQPIEKKVTYMKSRQEILSSMGK